MLMVTHNMGVVAYMADKVGVMHHGHLVEWGKKTELLKNPQHPYTRELIRAIPTMNGILPQYQETPQMKGWKNKVWYSEKLPITTKFVVRRDYDIQNQNA